MESYDELMKIMLFEDVEIDVLSLFPNPYNQSFNTNQKLTTGVDFRVIKLRIDEKVYQLQIWDCSVEDRFHRILHYYCAGAQGALLLFDVSKSQTRVIYNIENWTKIVRLTRNYIPIMLVGIISNEITERQISTEQGIEIAKSCNLNIFMEYDIMKGESSEKMFKNLARMILEYRLMPKDLKENNSIKEKYSNNYFKLKYQQ